MKTMQILKTYRLPVIITAMAILVVIAGVSGRAKVVADGSSAQAQGKPAAIQSSLPVAIETTVTQTQQSVPVITPQPLKKAIVAQSTSAAHSEPTTSAVVETVTVTGHVYNAASGNQCGNGIVSESCNLPAVATVDIKDTEGNLITTVESNSQGTFTVNLAAGTYRFAPRSKADINPDSPEKVVGVSKDSTDVVIIYEAIASTNAVIF